MSDYALSLNEAGGGAPFGVQLAPGQAIRVMSIVAEWDGAGASGSFYAALSIYSPDGVLVSRTRPEQVFAVGDTGVVTYAPFLHSEPEPAGAGVLAFTVSSNNGGSFSSDVWLVASGGAGSTQVTSAAVNEFYERPILSPDASLILFCNNGLGITNPLWIMDADGSNMASLVAAQTLDRQWIASEAIAYLDAASDLRRIDTDGTGAALISSRGTIQGYDVSPDGATIAYITNEAGVYNLYLINADGTGDTLLVGGLGAAGSGNDPVFRLDGSRIVFPFGAGFDSVLPDGTGQQTELAVFPTGFYFERGMADTALFFTDTSVFADWRLGRLLFGTGYAAVSPALLVVSSVFRGVAFAADGRVYTVAKNNGAGGEDCLTSILPDGSDATIAFTPDESGAPLFETVFMR